MNTNQRATACDQAYRDHAAEVYRVAYGILRDSDEAFDATHDSFARAWERWEQYDSKRPLRPWLLGICVRVCLDQLRRRRLRRLVTPRVSTLEEPPGAADLAREVVERHAVAQAMAELPPESRAALVLRHYYGFDYAQIGDALGKPSGTVGSLLSRAHAVLRLRLNESAGGDDFPDADAGKPLA